jgi:hypothetical protein
MVDVEIFMPTGVLAGSTGRIPLRNNGPDLTTPLTVADARWYPIDGGQPSHRGDVRVPPDEILLIVTPEREITVHMTWYAISLEIGPYRVSGSLATLPGFDPERTIARPSSTFVGLRDATIELIGRADVASAARAHVHVNRYVVERVASSLMLGFYFPGARMAPQEAVPV